MKPIHWGPTLAVLAAALLASGCGSKSDADLVKSAKAQLEKKDYKAAVIQLKGALQKNANSGEARYLLGRALLESGDPVAAAVELQKAADLKYTIALVLPALARAQLAQNEYDKVIDSYAKFVLPDARAQADLLTSVATAHARKGNREAANATLAQAQAAAPDLAAARLLQARLLADAKDLAGAQRVLDEALAQDPKLAEAWQLKGDIQLFAQQDRKAAIESYRKAVEIKPDQATAHVGVIEMLLADRDVAGAKLQADAMKKALPNHPQTIYFQGVIAYLQKDFATARTLSQQLVQAAPTNALALQLAGSVEYQLRSMSQAETYLSKAVQLAPSLSLARLLLAQTQLRTGQPGRALETLAPALEQPNVSADVLAVAAEAHLHNGDAKKSEELYTAAMKARPDDTRIRTARALGQLRQGGGDSAMADLQHLADLDQGIAPNMALISAHLRKGELDKALSAIAALEKKQPDKPIAANLRGRVLVLKKDQTGARAAFEQALKIDKKYYPAVASLAALDLVEKKPEDARKRFDAFLKEEPKSVAALTGLAGLLLRTGAPSAEVTDALARAVKADPTAVQPRLRLIEHQLNQRDLKAALSAAQDGVAALPNDGDIMQALGRVQLAQGEVQQAVTTLNKLIAIKPDSPQAHMALGEAYLARKDDTEADKAFRKALALRADLLPAQRALIGIAVSNRKHADALVLAKQIQEQRPKDGVGQMIEGDIERSRKSWDAAAAAYRASLQKLKSPEVAVRLHTLLLEAGKAPDADRFAAGWEKENPKDVVFLFHRADMALHQRDLALAETRYRAVTALQPNNALALNNIAWLMVTQNKPGALEYAQKANELLPNQPALLDTLASALGAEKKVKEALEMQKKAVALAPQDNGLRLNLAKLLVASGDKAQARIELQLLEKLGTRFPEHQKVQDLLKSVNS